ncbi:MAG: ATP-binding protein [Bacteroidota bacterium]|nr:ATP-binding protein [Bacteroidota bacterium]MDP4191082.1 ATP-binding protein [Bacteroidota bacterium]MDP4196235.1 ATP-binding protein [Bacteroidota bacterium]
MNDNIFFEKIKKYRIQFKHLTVLFVILMAFQVILSFVHKASLQNFLVKTQEWYQRYSAERLANITTTSLELLLETVESNKSITQTEKAKIIQAINIILSQQILQQNVQDISLLVSNGQDNYALKDGDDIFSYLYYNDPKVLKNKYISTNTLRLYKSVKDNLTGSEQICSVLEGEQTFHIFVPFILRGECIGALYLKNTPDFSFITKEVINNYNETVIIYSSLIFLGLLAMYYISSYTVKERDEAQKLLLDEHEKYIKEQVVYEKEALFTKRIYHTHHKAEKIMGFIKEDLIHLSPNNIDEIKYRITQYSNFISRVIYDMKWFDPPVQTIRNVIFQTNLNEVIKFIVDNIFLRISSNVGMYSFNLELDKNIPIIHINEFVIWEIIEPLVQNSIDHGAKRTLNITIKTCYSQKENTTRVFIKDDGYGIMPDLLEKNKDGVKRIFLENTSTKKESGRNRGYGCFLAYTMARERCCWDLDVENLAEGGCQFIITLKN